jgi:hypothetical protein
MEKLDEKTINEICEKFGKYYHPGSYAVLCNGKMLCFTGPDIMSADNIVCFLRDKYPENQYAISDEILVFED